MYVIIEEKDIIWTFEGIFITPRVNGFDNMENVKITYSLGMQHMEEENDNQPLSPKVFSKQMSQLPHRLEGVDITWQEILNATASTGRHVARCQAYIKPELQGIPSTLSLFLNFCLCDKFFQI